MRNPIATRWTWLQQKISSSDWLSLSLGFLTRLVFVWFVDHWFDGVLYTAVIGFLTARFGPIQGYLFGTGAMMAISGVWCLVELLLYDKTKKDVVALEREKAFVKAKTGKTYAEWARQSNLHALVAILFWPILTDPFFTTVRLRPHRTFKMDEVDWMVFYTSVVIGNLGWGLFIATLIWLAQIFGLLELASVLWTQTVHLWAYASEWIAGTTRDVSDWVSQMVQQYQ